MRLLFGLLLVLSIVLFGLMQWGGVLTGSANNVQVLAELNPEKIILLDRPSSSSAPVPASAPLASSSTAITSAVAASEPVAAMVAASAPAVSAPVPASAPATVKEPVAAPAVLAAPAPVRAPAPVTGVKATAGAGACLAWGEFSGADLKQVTQSLSAMKLGDRLVQRTVEYSTGYWVHMPPLKNKAAVNRKISQLKALGVDDYYVVNEPPKLNNVISLGVFKTHEAALNYLASLKKKGVRSAAMGERKQKLRFIVFEFKHVDSGLSSRLAAMQKEFAYSELTTVPCNKESR